MKLIENATGYFMVKTAESSPEACHALENAIYLHIPKEIFDNIF